MKIVIVRKGKKFEGQLYMDEELMYAWEDNRPGCAVRQLINWLANNYGFPDDQIQMNIEGW